MELENKTIPAGILGPTSYSILRGMPTNNPELGVYLLNCEDKDNEKKLVYSLWIVETLDEDGNVTFRPYKGKDYEVLMKKLLEDYVEHWSPDNFSNIKAKEEFNNVEENKMKQNKAKSLAGQASDEFANEAKKLAEVFGIKFEDVDGEIFHYTSWKKEAIATFYYIRGLIFMSKGEYIRAIENYSNAIDYEPDSVRLYQEKPEIFQERFKADFSGITPADCIGTFALQKRGRAYLDNGDFDEAIADFEQVVKFDPSYNNFLEIAKSKKAKN